MTDWKCHVCGTSDAHRPGECPYNMPEIGFPIDLVEFDKAFRRFFNRSSKKTVGRAFAIFVGMMATTADDKQKKIIRDYILGLGK
jgi:hypothetical protein